MSAKRPDGSQRLSPSGKSDPGSRKDLGFFYGLLARLAVGRIRLRGWISERVPDLSATLWCLGIWVFGGLPALGLLNNFRHGSAHGNEFIDIAYHVLWIVWNLILLVLIACAVVAARRRKSDASPT